MVGHPSLKRTSPKGTPFVGVCPSCGTVDLTLADMKKVCTNPMSQVDALMKAITDD